MQLRNRVRAIREDRQLSQVALAKLAGISRPTLRAIERDDGYRPTSTMMIALATALGTDMGHLFWTESEDAA